jgi:hypothetical protein
LILSGSCGSLQFQHLDAFMLASRCANYPDP